MKRLGFEARLLPFVVPFAFAAAALTACGGPKGRPNLPPPEYEEPAPPASTPAPTPSAPPATAAPLPPASPATSPAASGAPATTDAGAR